MSDDFRDVWCLGTRVAILNRNPVGSKQRNHYVRPRAWGKHKNVNTPSANIFLILFLSILYKKS